MTAYLDASQRVLQALKDAAPQRVSTWDLIHQAKHSRAVGRIWELAKVYEIEHVREPHHVHRWIYKGLKARPTLLEMMA